MAELTPGRVDTLLAKAQAVVDAVAFDEHGVTVAGEYRGGNGGLLSNETIAAADALRTELLMWRANRRKGAPVAPAAPDTGIPVSEKSDD